MNDDANAALVTNDIGGLIIRVENLQPHPQYTTALTCLMAARKAMDEGRTALHQEAMRRSFGPGKTVAQR